MKKYCAILAAGLLAFSSAQATVYEFRYTANLDALLGPDGQNTNWLQIPGLDIRMDDTLTGSLFIDTSARFSSVETGDFNVGSYAYYDSPTQGVTRYTLNNDRTDALFAGTPFTLRVTDFRSDAGDRLEMYSDSTMIVDGRPAAAQLYVDFEGPTSTLGSTGIPGAELAGLNQGMYHMSVYNAEGFSASVAGYITSMTLVSVVPEPGTYAMLLAGLGLVGWRSRRRA